MTPEDTRPPPAATRAPPAMIEQLNDRSREVLRSVVDAYVSTGEPVGSRTLSKRLGMDLSAATIRNTMADLEEFGLLRAPHTSAGRLPTEAGLRLFVDGLLEIGDVSEEERLALQTQLVGTEKTLSQALEEATEALSGLSHCAGLVVAPKTDRPLKHIEIVRLAADRALMVLVNTDGLVENRILELPPGLPADAVRQATNYLNARLVGRTLAEAVREISSEIQDQRAQLDMLTSKLVAQGLATYAGGDPGGLLIVKGQSRLLGDGAVTGDLESIRQLFQALETKEAMMRILDTAQVADGVQIFIGAENTLFQHAGWSVIIAPYRDQDQTILGAIGVIGPTRLNYARIVPMVDYTAKTVSRLMFPTAGDK